MFICQLRKKLANPSGGKNYIETVWGRGYVLEVTAVCMCARRSANETFLFINEMNELAGKSTFLAMGEHVYQHGGRPGERSRACPLTERRGCQSSTEREGERRDFG